MIFYMPDDDGYDSGGYRPPAAELADILYGMTNDRLKKLTALCDDCRGATRKDDLVRCIHRAMMMPESLRQMWQRLDDLSRKAVAAAYHNEGEFNKLAFIAQYGGLPERPQSRGYWSSPAIVLDLFLYDNRLPTDLLPLLADIVPPPDKFQLTGLAEAPATVDLKNTSLDLMRADTERAGRHDLLAYLRLVDEGQVKISESSQRVTGAGIKKILASLLEADFLSLPEKYRANQTIRPFGLDVFAQESGLATKARGRNTLTLTPRGREYYQSQDPQLLLEAFETWTQQGSFDELTRISALRGLNARGTRLTKPASRREAVIEALSWCPVKVWLSIEDFYRAVKIWHFDFDVETTDFSNLYVGHQEYGALYGSQYWTMTKGLYINAIIWEYLAAIGAVDVLYTHPSEGVIPMRHDYFYDDYLSLYDGLWYFRINNLGAYLLGQAGEYKPAVSLHPPLFTITPDLKLTLLAPKQLTPNDRNVLEQVAVRQGKHYRLDTLQLLTALENGADFDLLADFLVQRHSGSLPEAVTAWLDEVRQHSRAFCVDDAGLFVKVGSPELVQLALADEVLQKFCYTIGPQTLVLPARKEKNFRARLKDLGYVLLE